MLKVFSNRLHFYGVAASFAGFFLLLLPNLPYSYVSDDMLLRPVRKAVPLRLQWRESRIKRGDTFASLMEHSGGLSSAEVERAVEAVRSHYDLSRLHAGASYREALDLHGRLLAWRYEIDPERSLAITFDKEGDAHSGILHRPLEHRVEGLNAVIEDSLYGAVSPEGTRDAVALQVADMFSWEVDFYHDLRKGDKIQVVYETLFRRGKPYGTGPVLAAELTLSGHSYQAYFYRTERSSGYYDGEGRSLRKQFLRSPLRYGRITSGFTYRRYHPILHGFRPHLGVDFAAPTGTPIHATADGVVEKVARNRGEGRYVILRHPNRYKTTYMHMSRFARNMRKGRHVTQGQTIGYVGSTGLATGPHVDYRMQIRGKYVNPRTAVLPPAAPIAESQHAAFDQKREVFEKALRTLCRGTRSPQDLALIFPTPLRQVPLLASAKNKAGRSKTL